MSRAEVTIMGPSVRRSATFATDVPVKHLLPSMVSLAGDGPFGAHEWVAASACGEIDQNLTISQLGLDQREPILIARRVGAIDAEHPTSQDKGHPPTVVPRRLGPGRRVRAVVLAVAGIRVPMAATGRSVAARAVETWRWSEHRRRLDWLIGRHRLRCSVVIAVCSTGPAPPEASSVVSFRIAHELARVRHDRISLVDGDPGHAALTHRCRRLDATIDDLQCHTPGASGTIDARFGGPSGTGGRPLTIGLDLSQSRRVMVDEYRSALDRVRSHAAVIVIDVGSVDDAGPLVALADQVVVVVERPTSADVKDMVGHRPAVIVDAASGFDRAGLSRLLPNAPVVTDDDQGDADQLLAIALIDGWRQLDALMGGPVEEQWE